MDKLEELLGKKPTDEHFNWQAKIRDSVVMVTGAGGFIGSELCKRIADARPDVLILVDTCEFTLYEIDRELHKKHKWMEVIPVLASYGSSTVISFVDQYKPKWVFHAGAYKHVPMVERNPLSGVDNNVMQFMPLVEACKGVGANLVVVSSDKAVNPTNVMGATKKVVEDVALAFGPLTTRVVRFGNVMWSSGSVLPLFSEQLKAGEDVTVTHEEVDRYFMTVGQAVSLVLQSIALPERGIYALDMGTPVKIVTLVKNLAARLGITDYKIKFTGLRPGEKLHEELTLGQNLEATEHPQIMYAKEPIRESWRVELAVFSMKDAVDSLDAGFLRTALQNHVVGYAPACGIVDDLWLYKNVQLAMNDLDDCYSVPEKAGN